MLNASLFFHKSYTNPAPSPFKEFLSGAAYGNVKLLQLKVGHNTLNPMCVRGRCSRLPLEKDEAPSQKGGEGYSY